MHPPALSRWHAIVASGDAAGLNDLLADDIVFVSPVVHTPQLGKARARGYLEAALRVLGHASFRYTDEWIGDGSAVLEFTVTLDAIEINGVDIIAWNAAGQITRFKVMVRPLKALNLLHARMGALLAGAPTG